MKFLKLLPAIAIALGAVPWMAKADLIDLTPTGPWLLDDVIGNPTEEADYLETDLGLSFELTFLFKADTPNVVGALDGSQFSVTGLAASNGTAAWDLTGTGFELLYVLVKDGHLNDGKGQDKVQYALYNLYQVSPEQRLSSAAEAITVNGDRGISHVSFFGRATTVPDGASTSSLLGLALAAVAVAARRRKV